MNVFKFSQMNFEGGSMNRKRKVWLLLAALLLGVLLVSCGYSSIEIGMMGTHLPGNWQASYSTFTGRKTDTFQADAGQTLNLKYDVQVNKGTLDLQVEDPDNQVIWQRTLQVDQSDTVHISLEKTGHYSLLINGRGTGGSWDLKWNVE
jgi:hypothetical protein